MHLSDKTYDFLKFVAQLLLPGLGTLYFTLAGIWGFPYGEQVVGTITAIDTFLGVILGISTAQYKKAGADGVMRVSTSDPEKDVYSLELNDDPAKLAEKKSVTFTVNHD